MTSYKVFLKGEIDYYTDDYHEAIETAKHYHAEMFTMHDGIIVKGRQF